MMLVKVISAHSNGYGQSHAKAAGDEYDLPDDFVDALTAAGLIEPSEPGATAKAAKATKPALSKTPDAQDGAAQNGNAEPISGSVGANRQD